MLARPTYMFADLGLDAVDRGLADPRLARFLEDMRAADGIADSRLRRHLPYLSLCSDAAGPDAPPPIFYVGHACSQRQLFGDEWTRSQDAGLRTPDPGLEAAAADGYRLALERGAYYGYARTRIDLDGRLVDVAFERLIVALKPRAGATNRFCAYFGLIQEIDRQGSGPA
ncbi:hypothetical protein GWI72_07425 [Microvirga tunisiensis]|uniref:Uncharacterized protein n=2 Tax=Pannonibacter tanglangensis TaxID=2750084 RepID=A0ABW9ZC79_9HYPH|nr:MULTISPECIES: hypothetical protein [unclassified Pannonibacter]NBN62438.1 hypothetical protein [Pannonibacter sp. XCT-34]NBN78094.1 hypothetical protein [Pannonibacter sp. XCT-53]